MNSDIRVNTSFYEHHKVIKLARRVGVEGCFSLVILWCAAGKMKPDGILKDMNNEDIAIMAKWDGNPDQFVDALLECKLLDRLEDGRLCIHDWEYHNAYAAGALDRKKKARKAAAIRHGKTDENQKSDQKEQRNDRNCKRNLAPGLHDLGQNDTDDCIHDCNDCTQDRNDCTHDCTQEGVKRNDGGQKRNDDPSKRNDGGQKCNDERNDECNDCNDCIEGCIDDCILERNDCASECNDGLKNAIASATMKEKSSRNQVFLLDVCSSQNRAMPDSDSSITPSPSPSPSPSPKDKHGDCIRNRASSFSEQVKRDEFVLAVVDAFTRTCCPELPRPNSAGPNTDLYKSISARCRNNRERRRLSWWVEYWTRVSRTDFLMGRVGNWRANASWLVGPKNMQKVLDGNYDSIQAKARDSPKQAKGMSPPSPSGSFERVGGFFDDAMNSVG